MTRTRILSIALVVLVLLNLSTLGVLVFRKPPHPRHERREEGPKALIIERLHLDATQVVAYEALIKDHQRRIEQLSEHMAQLREQLYTGPDSLPPDPLLGSIGETQIAIERTHTEHFAQVRGLCRPDQLPLFDALREDLVHFFKPGRSPRNPR
jgi:periplasmic protein CpxP/Spy